MSPAKVEEYGADAIRVLKGLEPVRLRPGMYVGGTNQRSLHHLIWEIVDNAVDEALAGHCDEITVDIGEDEVVTVTDNGRGIPVGVSRDSESGESVLYAVFEVLHAGGKFGGENSGYKVSGGLHGVGASVTNALSEWCRVKVEREGNEFTVGWAEGKRVQQIKKGKASKRTGTQVSWLYDHTIFDKGVEYDFLTISRQLREKSCLVPGLKFVLNFHGQEEQTYLSQEGVAELIADLAVPRQPLYDRPLRFATEAIEVVDPTTNAPVNLGVDVALTWTEESNKQGPDQHTYSYANIVPTPDHGEHLVGLKSALTRALNAYGLDAGRLKKTAKTTEKFDNRDIFTALTCAVSVKLPEPKFNSQTKDKLMNDEARSAVQIFVRQAFSDWLVDPANKKAATLILERCLFARSRRLAQGAVKTSYAPNSIFADNNNTKLRRCSQDSDPLDRELFIVEGDSAGGPAKQGSDIFFQAVLPLRGKPINALTASNEKLFENEEVKSIINALGGKTIIGEERKNSKGKKVVDREVELKFKDRLFGKVVLLADADSDGAHITYLVMGIIYELFPDLIEEGRLFMARPPLFRIKFGARGEHILYAYSEDEMRALRTKHRGADVVRFKGLGEMNADQLKETVLDPKTRHLVQVTVEDMVEFGDMLDIVMGSSADRRKQWLEEGRAKASVETLD